MDISSVASVANIGGMKPMMASVPVLSSAQNQSERITRQAVAETVQAEKSKTEQKATDQRNLTQQQTDQVARKEVDMEKLVEKLNLQGKNQLQFSVDKETNQTVVKVIDKETQEVIKQFPSAEAMELSKNLGKYNGALVKESA